MHAPEVSTTAKFIHRLTHLRSVSRLSISLGLAILGSLALGGVRMEPLTRAMVGWDFGCVSILTIAWITFFSLGPDNIRLLARRQDASRPVVSILVIAACVTSLIAILDLLSNRKAWVLPRSWEATIYLTGVFLSWFLLHTSYTFRYAHFFYGDHPSDPNQPAGGLVFPGDTKPCYMDFAYFSFVIGMTFQVSDVAITSPRLRKAVLMHGLLSFIFNTVIVALTINEVVNLRS